MAWSESASDVAVDNDSSRQESDVDLEFRSSATSDIIDNAEQQNLPDSEGQKSVLEFVKEVLHRIETSRMEPASQKEIWFGVSGKFVRELEALKNANVPCYTLPKIQNLRYVLDKTCMKVTKRTPLDPSLISDLYLVDSDTWNFLQARIYFDIAIPRGVAHGDMLQHNRLKVETQPLQVWVAEAPPHCRKTGLQGTPLTHWFSVDDPIESLIRADLFSMSCPKDDSDVGIWEKLVKPNSMTTFYQCGLTSSFVVHATVRHLSKHLFSKKKKSSTILSSSSSSSDDDNDEPRESIAGFVNLNSGGLVGLQNLGNTCFMNSALQCLSHTMPLSKFFLSESYIKDLNEVNPLGMKGRLACAYADFLREAWTVKNNHMTILPIVPRALKLVIGQFAPQFVGYQQQDSQELAAFLLDGLHEDLNRVIHKPIIEMVEGDDTRDSELLAKESWNLHCSRNDSIVVDLFQGQYRSRLQCPICHKISVVFDPFMYLSLPLPTMIDYSIVPVRLVFESNGHKTRGVNLNIYLTNDDRLESIKDRIITKIISMADELSLVKNNQSNIITNEEDLLDNDEITYQQVSGLCNFIMTLAGGSSNRLSHKTLRPHLAILKTKTSDMIPAAAPFKFLSNEINVVIPNHSFNRMMTNVELTAFLVLDKMIVTIAEGPTEVKSSLSSSQVTVHSELPSPTLSVSSFTESPASTKGSPTMNLSPAPQDDLILLILVCCTSVTHNVDNFVNLPILHKVSRKIFSTADLHRLVESEKFDDDTSGNFAIFYAPGAESSETISVPNDPNLNLDSFVRSVQPSILTYGGLNEQITREVTLADCLIEFQKEEQLGPENMWYCNRCKEHRQAKKKIDIWRLPKLLVIHLKRFTQSSISKPLDLSQLIRRHSEKKLRYELFAFSNHMGGLAGGHYTATVKCRIENKGVLASKWFEFDDSSVTPFNEADISIADAYMLFYERLESE